MGFKSLHILIFLFLIHYGFSQKETPDIYGIVSEIIEQSQAINPNDGEFNTAFENLIFYHNNRLNLNSVTENELRELIFLTDEEVSTILEYRNKLGAFVELDELSFAGLEPIALARLKLFITLKPIPELSSLSAKSLKNGRQELYTRFYRVLETQQGYKTTNGFLGDPNKLYLRYSYNLNNKLKAGIVLEKDAGEQFINSSCDKTKLPELIDYKNIYLLYRGRNNIKTLLIGSYSLRLGQGLLAWNGFSLGKSSLLNLSKKSSNQINPYTSANEVNFLRGFSTQLVYKKLLITPYVSYKKVDSKITEDSSSSFTNSIPILGLHRTENELKTRNQNREFISGLSLKRNFDYLKAGLNYQFLHYQTELRKGDKVYQNNNFSGNSLHGFSVDYSYRKKKLTLYGEYAFQSKQKSAHLMGAIYRATPSLSLNLIHRNYDSGYFTPYNAGFGEKGRTENERGTYFSLEKSIGTKTRLKVYTDSYRRMHPSFESKNPYWGTEFFSQIERQNSSQFMHYLRYAVETNNASRILTEQTETTIHRGRYHAELDLNYKLSLRSRVEVNHIKNDSWGHLFYQDIRYYLPRIHTTFSTRYASFNIPSFKQAIYAYENDVLFFFNTPAYFNKGTRIYVMTNIKVSKKITFWLRLSRWRYDETKEISSGNSKIEGNKKTDLHFQTQLTF